MAKRLKADGQAREEAGGTAKHNVQALQKVDRECAEQMLKIRQKRRELNDQAAKIRKRVKDNDLDVDTFNLAVRLLEKDVEDRDKYVDSLRFHFESLDIGEQATLFPGGGAAEANA